MSYILIFIITPLIAIISAYFIAVSQYRKMKNGGIRYALLASVLIFLVSLVIIFFVVGILIERNVRFER